MVYFILDLIFQLLYIALIVRVIISWIQVNPNNEIVRLIVQITDPLIIPIRRVLPPMNIGLDISPIIAFFALGFIRKLLFWVMF